MIETMLPAQALRSASHLPIHSALIRFVSGLGQKENKREASTD